MKNNIQIPHLRNLLNIFIAGILLWLPLNAEGVEKTINTTVGSSFTLSTWSDVSSIFPGYSCASTFCKAADASAFTINVSNTIPTLYPFHNNSYENGFRSSYRVQALKVGIYIINGGASCFKKEGYMPSTLYSGSPTVTYHVIVTEKPIVTSISIPNNLTFTVGESYTFAPIITQSGASTTLSWNSSDTRIVSVTNSGRIKALTCGSSVITCTASNGVSAQCVVTVNPVLASGISLNHQELEIKEGDRFTLQATILPGNTTNKDIKWNSSNDNVAFVGANGTVIGVSPGYCNITATTTDGSNKSASCIVHVYKPISIESISFENSSVEIVQGKSITLKPVISPTSVSSKALTWTSSNTAYASVDNNGTVTGINIGTSIITVSITDKPHISASCEVIVKRNKYEIVFLMDGKVFKRDSFLYGQKIIIPEVPSKEGYRFNGWSNVPDVMPAADISIEGKYIANKYEITYKVEGKIYKKDSVEYNSTIKFEPYPSKEGYSFSGWLLSLSSKKGIVGNRQALLGTPIKRSSDDTEPPLTMPAHDITLYGTFSINTYRITYIIDDNIIQTDSVRYGNVIILPEIGDKEGYTFSGWENVPSTMPAKDLTIIGFYEVNYYQLTYIVDGDIYKTVNTAFGTPIVPIDAPTKTGFKFCGWKNLPKMMPAYDISVEAMFEIATNINKVERDTAKLTIIGCYDITRRKINTPQKGINIIRYSDGSTRKVFVK